MLLSILQKTMLFSLGFTLQGTFFWKKAVPHGWIPSSILTAFCCGTGCSWDAASAGATAEPVERWKVTWHLTSIGALVDPLSQPSTSVSCWKQCDWKPGRQTQIQSQHLWSWHSQRPLTKCNYVYCSVPAFCQNIYCDLPGWQKSTSQPSTGSGGFLFCSLSLNCMFSFIYTALHDIIYDILNNITKLNKLTNPLKASYNSAAQKWKSQLWYKCGLLFWSFPLCMKLLLESVISQVCLSHTNVQITHTAELTDVPQH